MGNHQWQVAVLRLWVGCGIIGRQNVMGVTGISWERPCPKGGFAPKVRNLRKDQRRVENVSTEQ